MPEPQDGRDRLSEESLKYLVHHIVLPPRLSDHDDFKDVHCNTLLKFVQTTFTEYIGLLDINIDLAPVKKMLSTLTLVMQNGVPNAVDLQEALLDLDHAPAAVHVTAQNAAIFIQKNDKEISFLCYEVLPDPGDVMGSDRLLRAFPGRAAAIPLQALDGQFIDMFSWAVESMGKQSYRGPHPTPRKVKSEEQDDKKGLHPHPHLVSQLLMAILEAGGRRLENFPQVHKRMRDDVIWGSSDRPWRRSPLWTVLRVSMQLALQDYPNSRQIYKNYMAYLNIRLCETTQLQVHAELMHITYCKAAQRISKLGADLFDVIDESRIIAVHEAVLDPPEGSSMVLNCSPSEDDSVLELTVSRDYINSVLKDERALLGPKPFVPSKCPMDITAKDLPSLHVREGQELTMALYDLESWVASSLDIWVASNMSDKGSKALADLLEEYMKKVFHRFGGDPEMASLSLLVTMELWCALDHITLHIHPKLWEHPPEIPTDLLEPLLLPQLGQLKRLRKVELHLEMRWKKGQDGDSVFAEPTTTSFTTSLYDESSHHQRIKRKIWNWAHQKRHEKEEERQAANKHYEELDEQCKKLPCLILTDEGGRKRHNIGKCEKCKLKGKMHKLTIQVDEWPLPADEASCKAVVVELDLPPSFKRWRDCTADILQDLGKAGVDDGKTKKCLLAEYPLLTQFAKNLGRRISLASTAKPYLLRKDGELHLPVSAADVQRDCTMSCGVFDIKNGGWTKEGRSLASFKDYCMLQLSEPEYQALQWAIDGISHTDNKALALQYTAHSSLSLKEFIAFGSLRAGEHVQLYNILRGLSEVNLSVDKQSVRLLFLQALWQAGSPDSTAKASQEGKRMAHRPFEDAAFVDRLITVCEHLLREIESNWNYANCGALIVDVLLRVISLTSKAKKKAMAVLKDAREVFEVWLDDLAGNMAITEAADATTTLQQQLLYVALICRFTFDVESNNLKATFESNDLIFYLKSGILIKKHTLSKSDSYPAFITTALLRNQRLSRRLQKHVLTKIGQKDLVNEAIKCIWPTFQPRPGISWSLPKHIKQDRWIESKSLQGQVIQLNILECLLYVDGRPIGNLPSHYVNHTQFKRLFERQALNVVTTDALRMQFMTERPIDGYDVLFSYLHPQLIIRTRRGEEIHELIPHESFSGDLPHAFIHNYTHWLNLRTGEIELRSLGGLGVSNVSNWTIQFGDRSLMRQTNRRLVDINSSTVKDLTAPFLSIERSEHIHVTVSDAGEFQVMLPRLKLRFNFEADTKRLYCPELKARVDTEQSLGTLLGLQSRLLLQDPFTETRLLLIPYGTVIVASQTHRKHHTVQIDTGDAPTVRYFVYRVQAKLQHLRGSEALLDNYYLVYLHAVTSHVSPDSLTGLTGLEQALDLFKEKRMYPIEPLQEEERKMLGMISELTPARVWYPESQLGQTITWRDDLPTLVQSEQFALISNDILCANKLFLKFHDPTAVAGTVPSRLLGALHTRAGSRNVKFMAPSRNEDLQQLPIYKPYEGQELENNLGAFQKSRVIGSFIRNPPLRFDLDKDIWKTLKKHERGFEMIQEYEFDSLMEVIQANMIDYWGQLIHISRDATLTDDSWKLRFLFCSLAFRYSEDVNPLKDIQTLLAFASVNGLRRISIPSKKRFYPIHGFEPSLKFIREEVTKYTLPEGRDRSEVVYKTNELVTRIQRDIQSVLDGGAAAEFGGLFNWGGLLPVLRNRLASCRGNKLLKSAIDKCQAWLDERYKAGEKIVDNQFLADEPKYEIPQPPASFLDRLFLSTPPILDMVDTSTPALHTKSPESVSDGDQMMTDSSESHKSSDMSFEEMLTKIQQALEPKSRSERALKLSVWPRITPLTLLNFLSFCKVESWRTVLIKFAKAIIMHQRDRRIANAIARGDDDLQQREEQQEPFEDWVAEENIPWLLFQIDCDILIRGVQARVAKQMIKPTTGQSSVLQLNMGEGKSSVIIPIVAASLADGTRLVRVMVLKPLLRQTIYSLRRSLGGLVGRRVLFIPFSRSSVLDNKTLEQFASEFNACKKRGDIVLTQPEHVQSFKLIATDKAMQELSDSADSKLAMQVWDAQRWNFENCRDILDESDEILNVRSQLIYTMGTQKLLSGGPQRWLIIQQLLEVLSDRVPAMIRALPGSVEAIERGVGGFTGCRLLDDQGAEKLVSWIMEDLSNGAIAELKLDQLPEELKSQTLKIISEIDVTPEEFATAKEALLKCGIWEKVLVLRGFLAFGILKFVLCKKRFRVEYGLDLQRCQMAVPYRAKDVPSLRAEFGQQDVAIALTYLSYYYDGLNDNQIRICFQNLERCGDPANVYESWVKDLDTPQAYRQLRSINLDDKSLCKTVFSLLRYGKSIIDFFLTHVVFPREAIEFPNKLSSSAWDIPSENPLHPTTGFSGTRGSYDVLPLGIKPADLPELLSTDETVLNYILQPENNTYHCAKVDSGAELLRFIHEKDPLTRCLFDVGAQILDLSNEQVAKTWLSMSDDHIEAALYIDEQTDEKMIVHRDGSSESLMFSVYQDNLENCLIYLDEVHTRGIDLVLPPTARAAVTLGPRLIKDRLVQACMRLRKLGQGQSVFFIAPSEVDFQIREEKGSPGPLSTADVLNWSMKQSRTLLASSLGLWQQQGVNWRKRQILHQQAGIQTSYDSKRVELYLSRVLEPEETDLEKLYGIQAETDLDASLAGDEKIQMIQARVSNLAEGPQMARLYEEQEREREQEREQERQLQRPPPLEPSEPRIHASLRKLVQKGVLEAEAGDAFLEASTALKHFFGKEMPFPKGILVTGDFVKAIKGKGDVSMFARPVNWVLSTRRKQWIIISQHEANALMDLIRKSKHVRLHIYAPRRRLLAKPAFEDVSFFSIGGSPKNQAESFTSDCATLSCILSIFAGQTYFRTWEQYQELMSVLQEWHTLDATSSSASDHSSPEPSPPSSPRSASPSPSREFSRSSSVESSVSQANSAMSVDSDESVPTLTGSDTSEDSNNVEDDNSALTIVRKIATMQNRGNHIAGTHIGRIVNEMPLKESDFEGFMEMDVDSEVDSE